VLAQQGASSRALHEMVLQHEHQHNETMLQTLCLARLHEWSPPAALEPFGAALSAAAGADFSPGAGAGAGAPTGLELVDVPGGPFTMGAPADRFSYDNERPRHEIDLPAFRIGLTAVTNRAWLRFVRGGGYGERQWWTDEGWALVHDQGLDMPGGWRADGDGMLEFCAGSWRPLQLDAPVCHVSFHEADAFARAHGRRLPTEAEWEKAALWDPASGGVRRWPWGDAAPHARSANLFGAGRYATVPSLRLVDGAAASGALGMIGDTWEWTSTPFDGYSGFRAEPYREYSEVFFGDRYRVLRGGSWATDARVGTATFRNWDLPQRRQIFAGVRLASEA
jgi:iron(II)-dependent oxidoreductase